MKNDNNIIQLKANSEVESGDIVPDWIVKQMIQSFAQVVKNPTKANVRAFTHSVKTFELWDA